MRFNPVEVHCCAGHKGDEAPRRWQQRGRWHEVREIVDRWYQGDRDPEWPIADYFKVADAEGRVWLLRHDRESDEWFVVEP